MADIGNSTNEPFFWIKTGRYTDSPVPEKQVEIKSDRKRLIIPKDQPLPPVLQSNVIDTARAGLQPGWIRASFIVREEYLKRLKEKAYLDRKAIKDVLDEIFQIALTDSGDQENRDKL